ncbi:hypothetical protein V2S66_19620 [Streptomyces sp. V4-01]|uniref:Lipoprotein n=1 Tax=Actinacidiphila polyblastidii TaxID=3110430 RepID=A0ABU7PFV8_9ACTN|nr:hypothetical protein [Streptomyces sp. V4-01]
MRIPLARVASLAALFGLLAACSVTGNARIGRAAGASADARVAGASGPGADLMALLVPYPAGARPWTQTRTGVMNLDEFLDAFYTSKNRASTRDLLVSRGFTTAVRHGWFDADGTQKDIWLVRFSSAEGAGSEYLSVTGNWRDAAKPTTTFALPAIHGLGELVPAVDDLGHTSAKAAASLGDVFLYARVYARTSPERAEVSGLAEKQYDALPN